MIKWRRVNKVSSVRNGLITHCLVLTTPSRGSMVFRFEHSPQHRNDSGRTYNRAKSELWHMIHIKKYYMRRHNSDMHVKTVLIVTRANLINIYKLLF